MSRLLFPGIAVDFTWEVSHSSHVLDRSPLFPEGL